jgi:hypothetical protein
MSFFDMDYFTHEGAGRLKRTIESYWAKRGLFPAVRVERERYPTGQTEQRPIFVVRSDLAFDERGFPYVKRTLS